MFLKNFKNIIFYLLIFLPISGGISSCSQDKKLRSGFDKVITSEVIPSIEAVAALGQL